MQWVGGEQYSKNIPWPHRDDFNRAGYAPLVLSPPYTQEAGLTRQHGNLSFSRVFQSGHDVAAYQPHIAWEIFNRAMTNKDVASGKIDVRDKDVTTSGPGSSFNIRDTLPEAPRVNCNIYDILSSCTNEQYEALLNGTAVIENFTVICPVGRLGDAI